MTCEQKACAYFQKGQGYSCAQAVFLPFMEDSALSKEHAAVLSAAFGGGVGGLAETCGALCGAAMALAYHTHPADPHDSAGKEAYRETMARLAEAFKAAYGSTQCVALKPRSAAQPPRADARPCTEYVAFCARYLEELL